MASASPYSPCMLRIHVVAAACAAIFAAIVSSSPAHAYPAPRSMGMSTEFPVGMCLDVSDDLTIDYNNLINVAPVSCGDPSRDFRVTQHVPNEPLCAPDTNRAFVARDVVVLCTVRDPALPPTVPGAWPPPGLTY